MLKIEYIDITELKPYEKNAKIHTYEQIEQIKQSIEEFGMNDPIGIWGKDNLIVEGHGRLIACQQLGFDKVPVIRLDDLTDEQRKAYTLVHNKTTMNTGFDIDILNEELDSIDLDMTDFGFEDEEDSISDLLENDFSSIGTEKQEFGITFYFDKANEDRIKDYVNEVGKDAIESLITEKALKEEE